MLLIGGEIDPFVVFCVFASEAWVVSLKLKVRRLMICILNLVEEKARIGRAMGARGAIPLVRGAAKRRERAIEAIVVVDCEV